MERGGVLAVESNTCNFLVRYDGAALADNTMDVAQLAPALLSLSEALSGLNALANKDSAKVSLQVRALNKGCFIIDFLINQNILAQIGELLTGAGVAGYCNAYTLLRSLVDLLELKRRLAGRKPDKVTTPDASGTVTYIFGDQTFSVNLFTHAGYQNPAVNAACSKIVEPLNSAGIDSVSISDDETESIFTKDDVAAISAAPEDRVLSENEVDCIIVIEMISFKDQSKWRVKRGERDTIYVSISDEDFLQKIDAGEERFGKGDVLHVKLIETQTWSAGKINSSYCISKVMEHKTSAEQLSLF